MIDINTMEEFKEIINHDKKVFILLHADWCPKCQQIKPQIKKEIYGINAENNIEDLDSITQKYNIEKLPFMFSFKNGELVDKQGASIRKYLKENELI